MLDTVRITKAIQFAAKAHANQVRKGAAPVPYVFHCYDVAQEVAYFSGLSGEYLETAIITALLHDVVEDTVYGEEELRSLFGNMATNSVLALTKDDTVAKAERVLENLQRILSGAPIAPAVKLADRVSNLKTFPVMWGFDKIASYIEESRLIAHTLAGAAPELESRLLLRIIEFERILAHKGV